jgi:NodT family efflux transporter outer membrane factor (OMF) lipoprotein
MLLLAPLAACTVGPDFSPPNPPAIPNWNNLAHHPDPAVSEQSDSNPLWWNNFHDPVLSGLMRQAIAGNPNLQEALLRVIESRQSVVSAAAAGLPTLSGNASFMREQLGIKGILESSGAYANLNQLADASSPVNAVAPGLGQSIASAGTGALNRVSAPVNLYQYGLSASWELDLFGRVRRSVEQAKASSQAQAEAANDALVMLESQVAQAYFALRAAQTMAQTQQAQISAAQTSLQLTLSRVQHGLTTDLDVEQARTQLYSEQAQSQTYEKQAEQEIDQLNILTGQPPGTLDAQLSPPAPLPAMPALVGVGIPSTLARRRPDIREAEAQLHAATANVGIAVASFYPDISLTGTLGFRATDASYLTRWASNFYTAGPSVSLPIFQGGTLEANLKMARAAQAAAAIAYRGTVLNALREVEDALVAYRTDQAARGDTANTVQAAQLSYDLASSRYASGLSSYLNVLQAESSLLSARQQLTQTNLALANDAATLYTAVGGGWENTTPAAPTVPAVPPPVPAAVDGWVP